MGARLGCGGDRQDPQEVPGLGGAVVMESFMLKFHVEGELGRERTPEGTCLTMSLCLVGLEGGVELIRMGPICLIRCRLSRLFIRSN